MPVCSLSLKEVKCSAVKSLYSHVILRKREKSFPRKFLREGFFKMH